MHRLRTDQFGRPLPALGGGRVQRVRHSARPQQERPGLLAAQAAVRSDLFLEGVHGAGLGVVHRVDHHIRYVRERVGAPDRVGRARAEGGQRALAVLQFRHGDPGAAAPQHHRSVLLAADEQESDAGVVGERAEQGGVAAVELLQRGAALDVGEGDQAEVA